MEEENLKSYVMSDLKEKQSWDLDRKVEYAKEKVIEFVEHCGGPDKVFISFSGGKDSCVLLHLVRSIYPEVVGVFFNTGLEYPEILDHVRTVENIEWKKPRKTVMEVWRDYGVPAVSKEYSQFINDIRNSGGEKLRAKRLNYRGGYHLPKKWLHFTDKEFFNLEVSGKCCDFFKKLPSKDYIKETGKHAIVGTMADESVLRLNSWVRHSCNVMTDDRKQSRPLSIWKEQDIWDYIEKYQIPICELYYKGYDRTGCFCCPYGCHLEDRVKGTNRYEMLKVNHPNQYKALEKLGMFEVLLNMQVPIRNDEEYMKRLEEKKISIREWYDMVQKDIEENGDNSVYHQYHKYFEPPKTKKVKDE